MREKRQIVSPHTCIPTPHIQCYSLAIATIYLYSHSHSHSQPHTRRKQCKNISPRTYKQATINFAICVSFRRSIRRVSLCLISISISISSFHFCIFHFLTFLLKSHSQLMHTLIRKYSLYSLYSSYSSRTHSLPA